jgi:hypothetical protein
MHYGRYGSDRCELKKRKGRKRLPFLLGRRDGCRTAHSAGHGCRDYLGGGVFPFGAFMFPFAFPFMFPFMFPFIFPFPFLLLLRGFVFWF